MPVSTRAKTGAIPGQGPSNTSLLTPAKASCQPCVLEGHLKAFESIPQAVGKRMIRYLTWTRKTINSVVALMPSESKLGEQETAVGEVGLLFVELKAEISGDNKI